MTIERSHGKARPTLPRLSDVPVVTPAANDRAGLRDAHGRFAPGNAAGTGRAWKRAIRKVLAREAGGDAEAAIVAGDAWQLYLAALRSLPSHGPLVRQAVAMQSRHAALSAFYAAKAAAAGLLTEQGLMLGAESTKHGQRAERLSVTALDLAVRMAAADAKAAPTIDLAATLCASMKGSP